MFNASSNTPLHRLQKHSLLMAGLLALALVMAISLSAGMGYMKIAWVDVLRVVGGSLTGNAGLIADVDELTRVIVMDVRLPRILTAAAVGGGLALCGVVFQGILLNPLADPYTLGVSAGAAFGAALALLLNLTVAGIYSVPVCAFAGATATLDAGRLPLFVSRRRQCQQPDPFGYHRCGHPIRGHQFPEICGR